LTALLRFSQDNKLEICGLMLGIFCYTRFPWLSQSTDVQVTAIPFEVRLDLRKP